MLYISIISITIGTVISDNLLASLILFCFIMVASFLISVVIVFLLTGLEFALLRLVAYADA